MKIQCSCGAKYQLDITPETRQPIQFVCPACGLDSSDFLNQLIRQQAGANIPVPPPPAPVPVQPPASPAPVRLQRAGTPENEGAEPTETVVWCSKHPGQVANAKCYVCSKPICPKCMELFGYVCSPLCKSKAESHGIDVPLYEGQRSVVQARFWRKVTLYAGALGAVVLGLLAFWFWYAWFGSEPKVVFAMRFPQAAYSGRSFFCGENGLVFLHSGTLALHDYSKKKELWSRSLVDLKQIDEAVAREIKDFQSRAGQGKNLPEDMSPETLKESALQDAAEDLDLQVHGTNIWVFSPGKLTLYDAKNGEPVKELRLPRRVRPIERGHELFVMRPAGRGKRSMAHVNLLTRESDMDEKSEAFEVAGTPDATGGPRPRGNEMGGLPLGTPGKELGKPLDPQKVAAQAQRLSRPERIALPALLANSMNQERIMAELNDPAERVAAPTQSEARQFSLMPTPGGFIQFAVSLVEKRIVERSGMKPKPSKSVLDGNVNVTQTTEVANEILNEMQRSRGGDIVREDESRYLVKLRRVDGSGEWAGEVTGSPALYPLKTVNVLAANKVIYVFNRDNKIIWQSPLSFNIDPDLPFIDDQNTGNGLGPCVEGSGSLYVFDLGVLTAFDLPTGNVRWRLPSVGIVGVLFDGEGMMYVNTTTAGTDKLKFSRQIDISDATRTEVVKLDPATGRKIWQEHLGGFLTYVSGKFMYTIQGYRSTEEDERGPRTGFETNPYMKIKRINPRTGMEMWEHFQQRAPLDVGFDRNRIRLVFKKEVQVLKFLSF